MPTNDERREVAVKLRDMACRTNPSWPALMDLLKCPGRAVAVQYLADLIEPEERTCRIKLSDCTDSLGQKMYRCSECGALMTDDACFFEGEPDIAWFSYCPSCGAKVVDDHA